MATKRAAARRLAIVNHKGGVGKTTLTFNVATQLVAMGKRVLLVDSDPQCNLTAYVIDGEVVDALLDESDGPKGRTVWTAVKPIADATGDLRIVQPVELSSKVLLLPGDIRLSDFEEELNEFWRQCWQRKKRGFSGTTAISLLVNSLCESQKIDYVFYDSGPNIGPLNRVILLDCDYFVIPVAYDLFSVRALKTLGRTLVSWIKDWSTIVDLAPDDSYLLPGSPEFLGYIPQNFTIYGGRPASHHARFASLIDKAIQTDVVGVLKSAGIPTPTRQSMIGEIKDFGILIPASQREGVSVAEVSAGTPEQRRNAKLAFRSIAEKIVNRAI